MSSNGDSLTLKLDVETLQRIELLFCESGAVKTRRYNLTFYPYTWTGKSLVDWLVSPQVIVRRIIAVPPVTVLSLRLQVADSFGTHTREIAATVGEAMFE
jgi:hypothetical protein